MGNLNKIPALLGGAKAFSEPCKSRISIGPNELAAVIDVMKKGVLSDYVGAAGPYFMGGEQVRLLEQRWTEFFGVKHALSVNSATSGLHAAVVAARVSCGDEVIIPPQTMSATATAVVMAGGIPVFADQDETTGCLSIAGVEGAITDKTKAIIAVNIFGGPAEVTELRKMADQRGLILIEDNAQGPGGRKDGQMLGTIGHLGVFSLNCHKTIQCGEGGVVVTDDDDLARRVALVRNHGENAIIGMDCPQDADIVGYNYRLTELQAAIAREQLERIEELTDVRLRIVAGLDKIFAKYPGLRSAQNKPGDRHVYYTYPLWIDEKVTGISRDLLVAALKEEGAPMTGGYVAPLYRLPLFQNLIAAGKARISAGGCPVAEEMFSKTFCYNNLVHIENGVALLENMEIAMDKVMSHVDELNRWQKNQDAAQ